MSTITLKIVDETFNGNVFNEMFLSLNSEHITVQDIIQRRVYDEVERYNSSLPEYYNGLVQPVDAEKTLNGYKMKEARRIDPEKQFYIACDAFMKNGYFILVNNVQAISLDQEVLLSGDSTVSFIKLTPLVGG